MLTHRPVEEARHRTVRRGSLRPMIDHGPLPDLFAPTEGGPDARVATRAAWFERAAAWRRTIVDVLYGGLPPAPAALEVETLSESRVRHFVGEPWLWSLRVRALGGARPFAFCAKLLMPASNARGPVVVYGDGGWLNLPYDVMQRVLDAGAALAWFDRTEIVADAGATPDALPSRSGGLYEVHPDEGFGALAAWAWGYHRLIDALVLRADVDPARIAVSGFSRGGKTALLAGATDERIAVVHDHASGAGGAAPFRSVGEGGETIDVVRRFPAWFGPKVRTYVDRVAELPFDQHALLASIAPRSVLLTYAVDDRWSNPEGMVQSAWAAQEVYRFLGRPDGLAFHLRPGGHAHTPGDWSRLLEFLASRWDGIEPRAAYGGHPYPGLRPAFGWRAPVVGEP